MAVSLRCEWLKTVHHDGSDRYLSNLYPALGETVRVRLRTGSDAPIQKVYLRTSPDGEQSFTAMTPGAVEPPLRWWEADLPVREPMVSYRFVIVADDGVWWFNGAGASAHIPTDVNDFQLLADYHPPAWALESVFYQIFPDRFANSGEHTDPPPGTVSYQGREPVTMPWGALPPENGFFPFIFYGGDLGGVRQRLDYLAGLGINVIYLNPIFMAYSNHRYDVADYEHVDPRLGGDAALIALREALDERGMRYLMDIVPNHCGFAHPWFQRAQADPQAEEAEFFSFKAHPHEYASWLGVRSLPKLNYTSVKLRRRIYVDNDSVFRRWLRPPFSADGWRVDVANMLGRQGGIQLGVEVVQGIRQAVKETCAEAYLIGEHFFDATDQLQGDQWDGVMNYLGFSKPLISWLCGYKERAVGFPEQISSPVPWPTEALDETWREVRAAIPWALALQQYNLLGSHDTPRIRSLLNGNEALHRLAVIVLMTYPGVPAVLYGDEVGMEDRPGLSSRDCMPWDESVWNQSLRQFYQEMIGLRRRSPILQRGGFQMLHVETDAFAYQREGAEGRILVVAHRGESLRPAGGIPVAHGGIPDGTCFVEHFSKAVALVSEGRLLLPELSQGATLWEEV